jgi:hypothetical protein
VEEVQEVGPEMLVASARFFQFASFSFSWSVFFYRENGNANANAFFFLNLILTFY